MQRLFALDDLRLVHAIGEVGTLTGAASDLGIDHSTAFRRLGAVEKRLGVRLFERARDGYTPTLAGEVATTAARQILEDLGDLERRLAGEDLRPSGTVRVTTADTLLELTVPILAELRFEHPEIMIELVATNSFLTLTKRDADIAIRPAAAAPDNLVGRRLAMLATAPYASPAYLARQADPAPLSGHEWIGFEDSLSHLGSAKWVEANVPQSQIVCRANSLLALRAAAHAGMGVAALPCYVADPDPALRRLHSPLADMAASLWLLTHPDLRRVPRIRVVLDLIGQRLGEQRALIEGLQARTKAWWDRDPRRLRLPGADAWVGRARPEFKEASVEPPGLGTRWPSGSGKMPIGGSSMGTISADDKDASCAALTALLAAVRERRAEFEAQQQISDDVVEMMRAAGVYRALVPQRFGGDEVPPSDFLRLIEMISEADGSAGWVASFGVSPIYLAALPLATQEEVYACGPDLVFAGGIFPPQKAVPVEGGIEVSGRWGWMSGCTGATLIGVGIKIEGGCGDDGLPRIAVMPREKVHIVRNWDVNGLKGTGSYEVVVEKVVVPESWTFVRGGPTSLDTPLYRYPSLPFATQVLAVVALGIARASIDALIAIAGGRPSITGAPPLSERAHVQAGIAQAEAALRSARAFFYETTEQAYARICAGDPVDHREQALLRLASTHSARVGVEVAQTVYRVSGTAGIFTKHPIAHRLQDALVVPQHALLADGTWQSAGRILLGLEAAPGFP